VKDGERRREFTNEFTAEAVRLVTVEGSALSQILANFDPAQLPGLADPAPCRLHDTRTAGLIQAGFARISHAVGLRALIKAISRKLLALNSPTTAKLYPDTAQVA
jgi:hypothetical protein